MNKPKAVVRKWIPGKKGKRGHFSACKRGHPWKGYGACALCRKDKDAKRHASKENKALEADRKRRKRWKEATNKEVYDLPDGYKLEILRGSIHIDSGMTSVILAPDQVAKLYEVIRDEIATNYPSKLPKAFREQVEQPNYTCGVCGVYGTRADINRADYHKPGCAEAKYCRVKAY